MGNRLAYRTEAAQQHFQPANAFRKQLITLHFFFSRY